MDHFYSASPLLFIQRELFNILVSEMRLRHRNLSNKGKSVKEFYIEDLVLLSKQVKSSRKYGIAHKLVFNKKRDNI